MANQGMDRRTFLKLGGVTALAGVTMPVSQLVMSSASASSASTMTANPQADWTMVVDLEKCTGCKVCETACRDENNVPLYTGDEAQYTAYWIRVAETRREIVDINTEEHPMPLLCNMCDDPPCGHVCPTKATFQRPDGLVLIDEHRCIGCRYCVIACPYHARSMVFKDTSEAEWTNHEVPKLMRGVASKCTFCVHRIDQGRLPRCVEDCPHDVLTFGDRSDKESKVARLLKPGKAQPLRPNMMLGSNVFYLGL